MFFSRFVLRFLLGYLILHLLMAGTFVYVVTRVTRDRMIEGSRQEMKSLALMLRSHIQDRPNELLDPALLTFLTRVGSETEFRYTVIDVSGKVLADSEVGAENIGTHRDRPEILEAGLNDIGFAERFSATLKKPMIYLAIPFRTKGKNESSGFVRVAKPVESINASIIQLQKWLWLFALFFAGLTGVMMAIFTSRILTPLDHFSEAARRIGSGALNQTIPLRHRVDEWGELAEALSQMQNELAIRENSLIQNNQRMQAVLSSMIEGVVSVEADGTVTMANKAACKMLLMTHVELIDKNLLDVVRYPELRKAIETSRTNRSIAEAEFETNHQPRRLLKARVSTLPNASEGFAVVLHDTTDLRALETMRRDFVANVSHELKTPLASIKAYAETLLMGAIRDQEKNVAFVEQIESQAELLNLQIQDLIELARIESGKPNMELEPAVVNDVCRKAVELLEPKAEQRKVKLSLDLGDIDLAGADESSIFTIVTNLVANGIHYTPAGGSVLIRTSRQNEHAVIEVIDTGIGIAVDQQTRVFERFYRVDKARSRDMGGTGLGLAIVKHLTQSFGGQVHLSSRVGKGSTFRVELPLAGS